MTGSFTRGYTFSLSGDAVVNAADLTTLIESATVAGVSRSDLNRAAFFFLLSRDQAPVDLATLEPWCDTVQGWPMTKLASGDPASLWSGAELVKFDSAVEAGQVLKTTGYDGTNFTVDVCGTSDSDRLAFVGVAAHKAASGAKGIMITAGIAMVLSDHVSGNQGRPVAPSTSTAGNCVVMGAKGTGQGPFMIGTTISAGQSAGYAWVALSR